MSEDEDVHYTEVPECVYWTLPVSGRINRDEIDDLRNSLRFYAPTAVRDELLDLKILELTFIRLYVGTDIPADLPIMFTTVSDPIGPIMGETATGADTLRELSGFMRHCGKWGQLAEELRAIQNIVETTERDVELEFGLEYQLDQ